jgi:methyl-accepting chemotaxis protein
MVNTPLASWHRSLTWRLLAPVGLMLLLIALLTAVGIGTRSRLHQAYDAESASQEVRMALVELRSISRSLQRDALNLLIETDRGELAVIHGKYRLRLQEMRAGLASLDRREGFPDPARQGAYLASQHVVLDQLAAVEAWVGRGDRRRALDTFRRRVRPNERVASRIADRLIAEQADRVAALRRRTDSVERQEVIVSSLAGLLLFAAAAALTIVIARRAVLSPLSDIEVAIAKVAAGETAGETPHIARADEIGRMARAIEVFRASIRDREKLREEREARRVAEAREARQRDEARTREDRAVAARSAALARSAQVLEAEVGDALRSLRAFSGKLALASRDLTDHSATARHSMDEVAEAVARAVSGVTDIAAATDQFTSAIADTSERTRRSAGLSADAAQQSVVLAARMARVDGAASAIGQVVNLIAAIAKQTNFLALNASIEAARGDTAGATFHVIAGEVKQLAGQTARATDTIAGQIDELQHVARDAGDSLHLIKRTIADMASESDLIAASIAEQAHSGRTINRNLTGAAADLDLIDGRVRGVAEAAVGVDALAQQVRTDAATLDAAAAAIDGALSAFFAELEAVRTAAAERREPVPG